MINGYRGMGHMGNGVQGNRAQLAMGYREYRPHGQWGTMSNWVQGLWAHG